MTSPKPRKESSVNLNDSYHMYQQDRNLHNLLEAVRDYSFAKAMKYPCPDPESIAQECMLRTWQILDKYDPERGNFRAWVAVLVRNYIFSRCRSERHSIPVDQEPGDMSLDALAAPPDPDTRPARDVSLLPPTIQRIAARLTLGYSVREIAAQMGCSVRTVQRSIANHIETQAA